MPEIPFFHMGKFNVGKHEVTALNHRMSGFPGLEFFGPYAEFESVRDTLLEAGAEYGLRQVGARAYASVATESGWVANTVPAIYTGAKMKAYREWLPRRGFEANLALAGSYVPDADRGPVRHPVGSRLREVGQVRPRVHRPRGA